MSDRDIAAAAEIVTGNAFRALRQQAKGLRRQAQRIKRLRAEAARLETEAVRLTNELVAAEYGHEQCHAELLKAEAEVEALRVAGQMVVQAHDDGDDMQSAIDQLSRLLDAALAQEPRSE